MNSINLDRNNNTINSSKLRYQNIVEFRTKWYWWRQHLVYRIGSRNIDTRVRSTGRGRRGEGGCGRGVMTLRRRSLSLFSLRNSPFTSQINLTGLLVSSKNLNKIKSDLKKRNIWRKVSSTETKTIIVNIVNKR